MRNYAFIFFLILCRLPSTAQLKYLVEDFEGIATPADLKTNGVFSYGNIRTSALDKTATQLGYAGKRLLKVYADGHSSFGGWGIGLGAYVELDYSRDYLNFYVLQATESGTTKIKIEIQEDDNHNNIFDKQLDDSWEHTINYSGKNSWNLISIPLREFRDANQGGDASFNASYKQGKIFAIIFSFPENSKIKSGTQFLFDFICFSDGALPTGPSIASSENHCSLGAWSKEGNIANFSQIATSFESHFRIENSKKLGVVHIFQPFAVDGGNKQNFYPSVERINKIIADNYIPLITLEDHFVNARPGMKQPNLYSIIEGHFDGFFAEWAKQMKKVNGTILLRILHEFNGDWYPWCIVNNDKNPQLVVKAFRHIHEIFRRQDANNVRFIWCPNSKSIPQESWNYIMEAYPGDEYVDYIGLDVYNGAGKASSWRSFRKEATENYFIARSKLPYKPIFICEIASRERETMEQGQTKAEWIRDMSEALKTDFCDVRLLVWFNEKSTFKINTSTSSVNAFIEHIIKDDYFKSGSGYLDPMIRR